MSQKIYFLEARIGEHHNPNKMMHVHENHELLFCREGKGLQLTPWGEVEIHKGDLFCFPAGQPHMSHARGKQKFICGVINFFEEIIDLRGYGENHPTLIMDSLKENAEGLKNKVPLLSTSTKHIGGIFDKIQEELSLHPTGYDLAIKTHMLDLFLAILRDSKFNKICRPEIKSQTPNQHMREVLDFIEKQYMYPLSIDTILNVVPLSRSHFHALFKKETGNTFIHHLNLTRIDKARKMLTDPNLSILQIAYQCGFPSQSHFHQIFKKNTGKTPRALRKELLDQR